MGPSLGGEDLDTMKWVIGFVCDGEGRRGAFSSPGQGLFAPGSCPAESPPLLEGLGPYAFCGPGVVGMAAPAQRSAGETGQRCFCSLLFSGQCFYNLSEHHLQLFPLSSDLTFFMVAYYMKKVCDNRYYTIIINILECNVFVVMEKNIFIRFFFF